MVILKQANAIHVTVPVKLVQDLYQNIVNHVKMATTLLRIMYAPKFAMMDSLLTKKKSVANPASHHVQLVNPVPKTVLVACRDTIYLMAYVFRPTSVTLMSIGLMMCVTHVSTCVPHVMDPAVVSAIAAWLTL